MLARGPAGQDLLAADSLLEGAEAERAEGAGLRGLLILLLILLLLLLLGLVQAPRTGPCAAEERPQDPSQE